jgi:hypothetical protein
VLLVVDGTTNEAFLHATLSDAWRGAPADSPNRGAGAHSVRMLRTGGRRSADVPLLLCAISDAAMTPRPAAIDADGWRSPVQPPRLGERIVPQS